MEEKDNDVEMSNENSEEKNDENDNQVKKDEEKKEKEKKEEEKTEEEKNEEKEKEDTMDVASDDEKKNEKGHTHERSIFSLEGAKYPISMYTRRVMDISKIDKYLNSNSTRGRCGGHNLGNTCFMNSSIACLSNCTELTYYFLKGDYKKDINEENTLGMRGDLAKSWGELLQQYWVEDTSVGNPSDFKSTIGRKAVRFRGYGQQDSHEFMSVFLDYLHEDLNRITKKEYIEMKEKSENESDVDCAKRFWECNLKRNDSIITDLFCGQYKSTITCPKCGWVNITFDPFDTVNLPLLTEVKRRGNYYTPDIIDFKFYYIPKYCLRNPISVKLKQVEETQQVSSIIDRIKKEKDCILHDKLNEIYMIDMYHQELFSVPTPSDEIKRFNYTDEFVVSFPCNRKEDELQIPVYFYKKEFDKKKENMSMYARIIFCKKNMTVNDLKKRIYLNLRKYILSPFLKENEEKDEISLEIEKIMNDKNFELDDSKIIDIIEKEYQELFKNDNKEKETKNKENDKMEEDKEGKDNEKKDGEKEEKKVENSKENKEDKNNEIKGEIKENENERENLINNFRKDMPFKISVIHNRTDEIIPFVNNINFTKLSDKLKEDIKIKSLNDTLEDYKENMDDYSLIVEFNEESKYINRKTFDLDHFEEYELDYEIKKEEPKKEEGKEEEEKDDGVMTLEKCIKKFCKEEQLGEGDEWYCPKCKDHVLAKKKMEFFYLPKILIICFKRFIKDSYYWEKNEDNVIFPINGFDMKEFVIGPDKDHSKYDLFAVSQHYGGTGGGHYTAVCKNNGKWFSYNDSSCHETSESDALSSAAYVLFYRRQTD